MHLNELKQKSVAELLAFAEELELEETASLRKQELMFAILEALAEDGVAMIGQGVLERLSDGFGFLRSPEGNYLPGPDDIYVSPDLIRQYSLRTGDTLEGELRAPGVGLSLHFNRDLIYGHHGLRDPWLLWDNRFYRLYYLAGRWGEP